MAERKVETKSWSGPARVEKKALKPILKAPAVAGAGAEAVEPVKESPSRRYSFNKTQAACTLTFGIVGYFGYELFKSYFGEPEEEKAKYVPGEMLRRFEITLEHLTPEKYPQMIQVFEELLASDVKLDLMPHTTVKEMILFTERLLHDAKENSSRFEMEPELISAKNKEFSTFVSTIIRYKKRPAKDQQRIFELLNYLDSVIRPWILDLYNPF